MLNHYSGRYITETYMYLYTEDLNLFTTLHSLIRVRAYISVYARFLIRLLNKLIRVVLVFSKRDTAPFALRSTNQPNVTETH